MIAGPRLVASLPVNDFSFNHGAPAECSVLNRGLHGPQEGVKAEPVLTDLTTKLEN